MYAILALMAAGYFAKSTALMAVGALLMFLYFVIISPQQSKVSKFIKKAKSVGEPEISGSKWSFSNPLRIKVRGENV